MNLNTPKTIVTMVLLVTLAYASVRYINIYDRSSEPNNFRSFSVSEEGKVVAVPDIAVLNFSIISEGKIDIKETQEDNSKKMNAVIDFLKSKGVDKKDISTQNYNITPRYNYKRCEESGACPPPEIVGYTIQQSATVKIRDFQNISPILSGLVENGANSVSNIAFTIDDPTELENQAREKAINKAKAKATSIADAGGFSIGRLLNIYESGGGYPMPYKTITMDRMGAIGGNAEIISQTNPNIEPGSQEIIINITLQYEIK